MANIQIEKNPSPAKLEVLGVYEWPTWEKEVSEFDWEYNRKETCYIISGKAVITCEDGDVFEIEQGDYITFPQGLKCRWKITEDIEKYYRFY